MRHRDEPSLPTWIRESYETLEAEYTSEIDELSHTDAKAKLLAEDENIEEEADAVYAIDRLLDRGWLYEVNDRLRKTE
ncbi:hypothetical protein [Haloarcula sediminis]|uniref:hypothetical protein n=1 Tax=Haloarcula sediminis TaxID=3111777 RepID=UPI002D794767|nr:hypothetical protein [Haloarcula sp. CK38]